MAHSLAALIKFRDDLIAARLGGIRSLRDQNGEEVEYKSDAQMAAALAYVEGLIRDHAFISATRAFQCVARLYAARTLSSSTCASCASITSERKPRSFKIDDALARAALIGCEG